LVLLAEIESSLGKFDRSIANYQRAIGVAPNEVRLYVALGRLHETQGDWQQAQTLYEKALAIQPEDALAANNLAYIMIEHKESVNVALTLAQTARRGLPNLPNSADTLGWAYDHNGAYSVAVPFFDDAVQKAPGNLTYRYHLGLTYQRLNDLGRARTEFEKSMGRIIAKLDSTDLIDGVRVEPLQIYPDDRGFFTEIARLGRGLASDMVPDSTRKIQISLTLTYPNTIKAIHYHSEQTDLWAPVTGMVQVFLYDLRRHSKTFGLINTIYAGRFRPWEILIPPGVGHGYKALG